ncbi:hypothetical protein BH09BAC1_BH09BAC1_18880 [soil metagenome]
MKYILGLIVLGCLASSLQAQISAGGTPMSFSKVFLGEDVPVVAMPRVDVARLIAEDETRNVKGNSFRFGQDMDVNLNLSNAGQWQTLKNGNRVWRMGIKSAGAYTINLIFSEFFMPEGASMYVYSADKSMVLGAFTSANNQGHGKFSTDVVKGDHTIIEYYEPAAVHGQGRIAITKVIHGYYDVFFGEQDGGGRSFGQSGSCNNNVACPVAIGWENQVNATLMYISGSGNEICSGSMLNNVRQDGKPYFLSANHCYSGDYATWIFRFNYQSPGCTPSQNGPKTQTVSGASLKAKNANSDFALYELSSAPPLWYNVYYAGWSNVNVAPTSSVGIHHPALDVKKFSVDNDPASSGAFSGTPANSHWRINDWDSGTTEGGSSGSPLFDQNKRVIGQLHGGSAACGNNLDDNYGKLAISWNGTAASGRLKDWLDPDNTGATVLDGASFNVPTVQRDVQLLDVQGVEAYSCNNTISATVRFQNRGGDTLTNLTYRYGTASGTWDTLTWTGGVAFGTSGTIAIPAFTLAAGAYTMRVEVVRVNGQADQDSSNDAASFSFSIVVGRSITVMLRTDNYGEETTLRIKNTSNVTVWEETGFNSNTSYTFTPCLAIGCYTFTILDSEGDGICCNYGNGSYTVKDADGVLVVQGGLFTSSKITNFCVTNSLPVVAAATVSDTAVCAGTSVIYTNTSTGLVSGLAWRFPGGSPATSIANNPTVTYSAAGNYDATLIASGPNGIDTFTINNAVRIIDAPSVTLNATNTTGAAAADGQIEVVATGAGPFNYAWNTGATLPIIINLAVGNYTVSVTGSTGCTTVANTTILEGAVGIESLEASLGIMLYPNPADEQVALNISNASEGTLQVYDNLGRLVYQTSQLQTSNTINVASWAKGVYHLRLAVPQGMVVKRFVVGL